MSITEAQYRTSLQNVQNRYIKFDLLNFNYQTVDSLEGVGTSGDISIDANADIRRSGNVTLVVTNSTFTPEPGGKIWLDKYIRVWVGIEDNLTGQIEWNNCGLYIIDEPSYSYDATTNTLTLSLLDLMAKLTGIRNGYLEGLPVILSAGENIRQAIISTLALGGFTKYLVSEAPAPGTIPNDLEFGQGSTIYDLLSGLKNIYPDYEMFFNTEGVFVYQPIPTGANENIIADDSVWEVVTVSESYNVDFQNVKNSIEVYGRTHEPSYFATYANLGDYTPIRTMPLDMTIPVEIDPSTFEDGMIFGFELPGSATNVNPENSSEIFQVRVFINTSVDAINGDLLDSNGQKAIINATSETTKYLCIQLQKPEQGDPTFYYLGHLQAYGKAEDTNPDSPFYINGTVGLIRLPLFDGDYANCLTDDLAQQRAEYELWLHTNMNNSITLSTVPVFWLDVNSLVEYTSQATQETSQYIIKSISFGLGETDSQTINMIKYYPEYSSITTN